MNKSQIEIEDGLNEANLFGIQLEEPMSSDAGKSLYHKPYGFVLDAAMQMARSDD